MDFSSVAQKAISAIQTRGQHPVPPAFPELSAFHSDEPTPAGRLEAGGFTEEAAPADFKAICAAVAQAEKERRGLLFAGGVGCGKTTAAKAIAPRARLHRAADIQGLRRLAEEPRDDEEWRAARWILDDLGTEQPGNDYGIRHEYAAEFLLRVCDEADYWLDCAPIITTNLNAKAIEERYGERVASRLFACFYTVRFTGGDLRRPLPVFGNEPTQRV